MMGRFTLQIGLLLMAVLTLSACSKDEEKDVIIPFAEVTNPGNNNSGYNGINGNAANYAALLWDMQGEYEGEWSINGQKVDAEEADVVLSSFIYASCRINFTSFPFKAIAWKYGKQEMDLDDQDSYQKHELQKHELGITSPAVLISSKPLTNETILLYDIVHDNQINSNIYWSITKLKLAGFSDNMLYFELNNNNLPFLGYPYVVTLEDRSYYAIVLDVVPSLSTLTFDGTTKTVNFVCTISQIELYDQDRNKTIREMNPEMILTFTSTQKTKAGESGD